MEAQIVIFAMREGTEHSEIIAWQFHWHDAIRIARNQANRKGLQVCNVLRILNADGSVEFDPVEDLK